MKKLIGILIFCLFITGPLFADEGGSLVGLHDSDSALAIRTQMERLSLILSVLGHSEPKVLSFSNFKKELKNMFPVGKDISEFNVNLNMLGKSDMDFAMFTSTKSNSISLQFTFFDVSNDGIEYINRKIVFINHEE